MSTLSSFVLNKQLLNPTLYARVRSIWFEGLQPGAVMPGEESAKRWFGLNASQEDKDLFDNRCHKEFHEALASIGPSAYPIPPAIDWAAEQESARAVATPLLPEISGSSEQSVQNALGLFLLLDQIPRNIYRTNQKVVYTHYDRIARAVANTLLKDGIRPDLHPSLRTSIPHRTWFYMPFMHSEHIQDHDTYDELFQGFIKDTQEQGGEEVQKYMNMALDFEKKHRDIIEKFGRYPYRNPHIGREATAEEKNYLENGGEKFTS